MDNCTRLSIPIIVRTTLFKKWVLLFKIINSVGYYSSVSSSDAVFIIGGFNGGDPYDSTVAKFTDYNWYKIGELNTGRYSHSSVSHNGITITLGGFSRAYDDVNTEFWDFDLSEGQEVGPELPRGDYSYGTALFLVELDFCTYPQ